MICIDNEKITLSKFADATFSLMTNFTQEDLNSQEEKTISWFYESNDELIALIFITRHLQDLGFKKIHLLMPYIPNARQDKIKSTNEIFTLKYFAEIINSLSFTSVKVLDPHSIVSENSIDNISLINLDNILSQVLHCINTNKELILCFPDAGSVKRVGQSLTQYDFCYGVKLRDKETRKILKLDINTNGNDLKDKAVLIIDDIITSGGTLLCSCNQLKKLGVDSIYIYASHIENIFLSEKNNNFIDLLLDSTIKHFFTTNSIYTCGIKKITTLNIFKRGE